MSKKVNNLVEIAQILIEMREERALNGVAPTLMARYPEGSCGIVINDDKYIVINSTQTNEVTENDKIDALKDNNIKYNAGFYFGTYESDEPDIIDDAHNKSKLISEAYTEVSFLPKDIDSQAEFDVKEAMNAVSAIITTEKSEKDYEDYAVKKAQKNEKVYDEIYRCRCVFTDISGNESIESLLIKAFKVSEEKGAEYSYKIINSDNIKEQVENLEKKVENDKTGQMRAVYSKISNEEYLEIEKHIKEGIEQYYAENSKKFYRLIRVDIKAIYCLRLMKTPIDIEFYVHDQQVAVMNTFYSMVAGDFNVFTCPNCKTLSGDLNSFDSIKMHIDHSYSNNNTAFDFLRLSPIGCDNCMERCPSCGSWHFKLNQYSNLVPNYKPKNHRKFLRHYANRNINVTELCECREYINWVYDEMSLVVDRAGDYCDKIIDKFLTSKCDMVFVNYFTGEVVAYYSDFVNYLYEYLGVYLKNKPEILKIFNELKHNRGRNAEITDTVFDFVEMVKINENDIFSQFDIQEFIKTALNEFKANLAELFGIDSSKIKTASNKDIVQCSCCNAYYYGNINSQNESYFNKVKNACACCAEALNKRYNRWERLDDNVTFYKSNRTGKVIRTFQADNGEMLYDKWLKKSLASVIKKIKSIN